MFKRHRNIRAQTTLFVILGIAIVAVVLAFMFFLPDITKLTISEEKARELIAAEKGNIQNYVENCVKISMIKNLNTMGRQGGRIIPEMEHYTNPTGHMIDPVPIDYAYYYDKDEKMSINKLPTLSEMKNELSEYVGYDADVEKCLELRPFKKRFFISTSYLDINPENMDLGEASGKIVVPFTYPVTISLGKVVTSINSYSVAVPINLGKVREAAGNIINDGNIIKTVTGYNTLQTLDMQSDSSQEKMMFSSDMYTLVPSENNAYNTLNNLITITYTNSGLEKPFIFNFAIGSE